MSQVAQTILQQLGGQKFLAMTGARNLVGGNDSLSMQLPNNARWNGKRLTGVRITLDSSDTYTVNAVVVRKHEYTVLESVPGVYCDTLQEVFTRMTGLHTHL